MLEFAAARQGRVAVEGRVDVYHVAHVGTDRLADGVAAGQVAVAEKPDVLWERPDLERLYARLEDEYELKERVEALGRKLAVIAETTKVLTDIIDTRRSLRLELIIAFLIVAEIVIAFVQILATRGAR